MFRRLFFVASLGLVSLAATPGLAASPPVSEWTVTGATPGGANFNAAERTLSPKTISTLRAVWQVPGVGKAIATADRVYAIGGGGPGRPADSVVVLNRAGQLLRKFGPGTLALTGTRISLTGDYPQALAYANGRLVVADTTEVQALDPNSGRRLWRVSGGALFITIANGVVYTGKFCQNPCGAVNSYAIDLASGTVRWVHLNDGGAQPMAAAGRVFQGGSMPNSTRVFDAATGKLVDTIPGSVFVADASGVYASRATSPGINCHVSVSRYTLAGKFTWQRQIGLCNSISASQGYGTLYLTAASPGFGGRPAGGTVVALNAADGRVRWERQIGSIGGISLANGMVFVLREYTLGEVYTLDAGTGKGVGYLALKRNVDVIEKPFVIAGGTLYISDVNQLFALRVIPPQPVPGRN